MTEETILAGNQGTMRPTYPSPPPEYLIVALVTIRASRAEGEQSRLLEQVPVWATQEELDTLVAEIKSHGYWAAWAPIRPTRPDEMRKEWIWLFED